METLSTWPWLHMFFSSMCFLVSQLKEHSASTLLPLS
ncbi:hypothetical protein GLYMA_16G116450v4 [Glycine max]|nr:hypothetical protein GLYMA_16G116450v4 [Glycine max]